MSISDEVAIMYNGRLQQVGPPQDIYLRPATTFVADFIGRANFIDGEVLAGDDDEVTLKFFDSTSTIPQDGYGVQPGDGAILIIRPEAIHLAESGAGFPGKVERATYLGSSVEYVVNVAGQSIAAVDYESYRRRIFQPGEDVVIRFDRDGFHLLKKDETTDQRA
jgi:iron(III) transport system ATP-binding protein